MPSDCLSETFEYEEALPFCLSLLSFLESFFFQVADVELIDSGYGFSLSELLYWSGSAAVFFRGRKAEQFCEARFVSLARGTVAIRLNPFGMFLDFAIGSSQSLFSGIWISEGWLDKYFADLSEPYEAQDLFQIGALLVGGFCAGTGTVCAAARIDCHERFAGNQSLVTFLLREAER